MKKLYGYVINGSGGDGQTWVTEGSVECEFTSHEPTPAQIEAAALAIGDGALDNATLVTARRALLAAAQAEPPRQSVFDHAMFDSFMKLTQGYAIFGRPGVGCKGPYDITQVLIKQVKQ